MRGYLDLNKRRQRKKLDKIKSLLEKLRKRRRALEAELDKTSDPDKKRRLRRDLRVLREQRKKGIKLVKELRKED